MYSISDLKNRIHDQTLSRLDVVLLLLGVEGASARPVSGIRSIAEAVGRRDAANAKKWNLSDILSGAKGLALRGPDGWELTPDGRARVADLMGIHLAGSTIRTVAQNLRAQLPSLSDPSTRSFVEEAIVCFESKLYRSAVVLSWVGAMAVLHEFVAKKHLSQFNAETLRRDAKWRTAKTTDDLGRMKEHDFLDVMAAISILGKNAKQELQSNCLMLRNGCGHPNSMVIKENRVAAHIEFLIDNVFAKFA